MGGRICFTELLAPLTVRLERNQTEHRRQHKKTDWATDDYLRWWDTEYHRHSGGTLPFDVPLLQLDTEYLTADEAAQRIAQHFGLPRSGQAQPIATI